jgi:phage baseplate assembly protein W
MTIIRGISYPLNITNGSLQLSYDIETIRDAIFSVLETRPTERVWRADFGTPDFIFESIQNPEIVVSRIKVVLEEQISGVEFEVKGNIQEDGAMQVQIYWQINGTLQTPIDFELTG